MQASTELYSTEHHGTSGLDRRGFLKLAGAASLSWLTPVGHLLARQEETSGRREPTRSIILLWLAGGPSQLETFDPHPGSRIAGETGAIPTAVKGIQLASGFARLAEQMEAVSLVRSMVSKEGDHERGTYLMKSGYRPDPTVIHPAIGAICCHELPVGKTEIPRHVSIMSGRWASRGGFLGDDYDAFQTLDPAEKVPDVTPLVSSERDQQRYQDLDVVERAFAKGRGNRVDGLQHRMALKNARAMMTSEQLKAFDVAREPASLRKEYGETPFGRGCLAARRLIEVGVRCVEVTLDGWDSHANNHEIHRSKAAILDPAFAALLRDLQQRDLLRHTVVLCCGEFGRTPIINRLGGRDHWPNGFSLAIAGGGIRGGQALGQTDPEGLKAPVEPKTVADIHATVLTAVGLDPHKSNVSPVGRPIRLADGDPIAALLPV